MKSLLKHPAAYLTFQSMMGAKRSRKRCIEVYARPSKGERVLDVGCGPGFVIEYLPEVDYVGTDIHQTYIAHAKKRYGSRGEFHCLELSAGNVDQFGQFDLVLLNGVLHHIDDNGVTELLGLLCKNLTDKGRAITLDGCFREKMSPISRYLIRNDRGQYVRNEEGYVRLAEAAFGDVTIHHRNDLFKVPCDALVIVCRKQAQDGIGRLQKSAA